MIFKDLFKKKNSENERQSEEIRQIDLDCLPKVYLPLITLEEYGNYFYAQINVKSIVQANSAWKNPSEPDVYVHESFLFEIEERRNISLPPEIKIVGNFPILFHPHFRVVGRNSRWMDYKKYDPYENLSHYLLRIARSLNYEQNYIHPDAMNKGNPKAIAWYKKYFHEFPIDKNLWECPMENLEVGEQDNRHKKAFAIKSKVKSNQLSGKMKKKFKIKKSEPSYSPESRLQPQFKILHKTVFRGEHSLNKQCLYIKKNAFRTIMRHIGWGEDTPHNIVEQGGILLGKTFIDPEKKITYGVIEQAIEGKLAIGTSGYLEVTHETWKEMFDKADELFEQSGSEFQIIGWYHTHPNTLDVFMSGTDRNTQSTFFANDWQFAIVLNPQKRIWRAFYGSHSKECEGYIIENEEQNPEHEK